MSFKAHVVPPAPLWIAVLTQASRLSGRADMRPNSVEMPLRPKASVDLTSCDSDIVLVLTDEEGEWAPFWAVRFGSAVLFSFSLSGIAVVVEATIETLNEMSRAWKHTADRDTDDKEEEDPLTPTRSSCSSHRQSRRRQHGGSSNRTVAVHLIHAQLNTLDSANSGRRSPFRNAMHSIDETPSTSATDDTAADTHPQPQCSPPARRRIPLTRPTREPVPAFLHRTDSGVGRTADDKHRRRQGYETR